MVISHRHLIILILAFVATLGCERHKPTSNSGAPATPSPVQDIVAPLHRVAKEIAAAVETGINRADYQSLLRKFATELSLAKDAATTESQKNALTHYSSALDIWKDSGTLWDANIEIPTLAAKADYWYETIGKASGTIEAIDKTLNYKLLVIDGNLPIESFPGKIESPAAVLATRYQIPIAEKDGWRYIPGDSFKLLWPLAIAKVAEANAAAKSR